jgi:para-aminobenzoate synthetase
MSPASPARFVSDRGREAYLSDIGRVFELLKQGETYEVCLTTQFRADSTAPHAEGGAPAPQHDAQQQQARAPHPGLDLYLSLRRVNPAPYAAFLHVNTAALRQGAPTDSAGAGPDLAFSVCCSSPERYLRVGADGSVESKPIKGTASRGGTPEEDAAVAESLRASGKDRAENLMITDLVRNDLGRVCRVGSVCVPSLMAVETYASVHQLVTTVRGQLAAGADALDAAAAAFPPGSMTGAPKTRTLSIIHQLERATPRGVYSGALGFFSVHGASDLNVVIRTAVLSARGVSLGAGGAIVTQSQPEDEWDEVLLKARPVMRAVDRWLAGAVNNPA